LRRHCGPSARRCRAVARGSARRRRGSLVDRRRSADATVGCGAAGIGHGGHFSSRAPVGSCAARHLSRCSGAGRRAGRPQLGGRRRAAGSVGRARVAAGLSGHGWRDGEEAARVLQFAAASGSRVRLPAAVLEAGDGVGGAAVRVAIDDLLSDLTPAARRFLDVVAVGRSAARVAAVRSRPAGSVPRRVCRSARGISRTPCRHRCDAAVLRRPWRRPCGARSRLCAARGARGRAATPAERGAAALGSSIRASMAGDLECPARHRHPVRPSPHSRTSGPSG
jgi:hypothetical protein